MMSLLIFFGTFYVLQQLNTGFSSLGVGIQVPATDANAVIALVVGLFSFIIVSLHGRGKSSQETGTRFAGKGNR
jgi:hypothetical protein